MQDLFCRLGIAVHLLYQRLGAIEFYLTAQISEHRDLDFGAIQIVVEIKHEGFQQRCAIVEGWATAKACDTIMQRAIRSAQAHRIDAMGEMAAFRWHNIGRGIAECAPELCTFDDFSSDNPVIAKVLRRCFGITRTEQAPDDTGRKGFRSTVRLQFNDGHTEIKSFTAIFQKFRRSGSTLSKMEIVSGDDMGSARRAEHLVANEIDSFGTGEVSGEIHHQQSIETRRRHDTRFQAFRRQAKDGRFRFE